MAELGISFGCMADPISDQLERQGYTISESDAKRIHGLVHALNMVRIHGLVSDSTCDTARQRLLKDILKCIKPLDMVENREEE